MTIGKAGILWKLDRVTGKFLDAKQTVFQNVYSGINKKTGQLIFRPDVLTQKTNTWISACPSEARAFPEPLAGSALYFCVSGCLTSAAR